MKRFLILILLISFINSYLLYLTNKSFFNDFVENIYTGNWSKEDDVINELNKKIDILTPEYSFKTHIIQFWWLHSKIYEWVYREIWRWDDAPQIDSMITDLPIWLVNIDYRGRKDFFAISCPVKFRIDKCLINWKDAIYTDNSCTFYFPETAINSDITFNCINDKFLPDL